MVSERKKGAFYSARNNGCSRSEIHGGVSRAPANKKELTFNRVALSHGAHVEHHVNVGGENVAVLKSSALPAIGDLLRRK